MFGCLRVYYYQDNILILDDPGFVTNKPFGTMMKVQAVLVAVASVLFTVDVEAR
jgi:hypothetical protein